MKASYHLPGLFEFYELYSAFLPLFYGHRDWFYDWCSIGSVYGAPADCLWGGGRVGFGEDRPEEAAALMREYGISARLEKSGEVQNGVILCSDLLLDYLLERYPGLYFISSTTKVLTDFRQLKAELDRPEFRFVVPDFRLNKAFDSLNTLSEAEKRKVEFLCNECCRIGCPDRKACYENVSRKNLGENCPDHICSSPSAARGYRFSDAMESPAFIGIEDIRNTYLPNGFTQFKIEGRSLGSAVVLEFLLYYLTKPEYRLKVREELYLDSSLDLW